MLICGMLLCLQLAGSGQMSGNGIFETPSGTFTGSGAGLPKPHTTHSLMYHPVRGFNIDILLHTSMQ